ncbi:MAG: hypothetical protein ABR610_06055 [Thermoanaerobaculia bacterium]
MIAFVSLFLGLVIGARPVTVTASGPVASVELLLDGAPAARIDEKPWTARVDFGMELSPHELVARALDSRGREIARARQWLNLPRPAAEMSILLQRDDKGVATGAQLSWASLQPGPPSALAVTFDGRPLAVKGSESFSLPSYDASSTHLLSASAEFGNGVRCRADVVLGGRTSTETVTELTGVAVRLAPAAELPEPAALEGWIMRKGEPLRAVGIERAGAQVLIVRDLPVAEALSRLGRGGRTIFQPGRRGALPVYDGEALRLDLRLGDDDKIRYIWPSVRSVAITSGAAELFESSHEFRGRDAGMHWLLTRISHPGRPDPARRYADATAVAGLQAVQSCTRRAVLLVLGKNPADASRYSPATVRAYLERIHVPLFVWSFEPLPAGAPSPWGQVEDVSNLPKLRVAFERLKRDVESQAIVWVEGQHLPQEIALSAKAMGMEIVR